MREMKDSGIEWIDEIPLDWTVKPLKWMVKFGKGLPITKDNLIEQGVPVVSYGQIHSKTNNGTHLQDDLIRFVSETYLESNPLSLGKKGDIFFADTSEDYAGIGNAVLVDIDTPVFAGYHTVIVRPDDQSYSRYLAYLFLTDAWRSQLCSRASGIKVFSITQGLLKKTTVILPPVEKAVAMTDYLDRKCSQIDVIIARQQEVIEKLKSYKLSVITEAVTKGLNPDVPMKDSGVEWIGAIPDFWDVVPLKTCSDILPGYAFSSDDFDTENGTALLRGINVTPNGVRWEDVVYWNKPITEQLRAFELVAGDIVVGLDRPWVSGGTRVCWVTQKDLPALLLQRVCRIRAKENIDSRWIYHWIASKSFQEALSIETTGVSVPHISTKQIGQFSIALPPIEVQHQICDTLEMKCRSVDKMVDKKQAIIDKLTEYKKSLIYEVVTGKKEV